MIPASQSGSWPGTSGSACRHSVFFIRDEEGTILSLAMKDLEERLCRKTFEQTWKSLLAELAWVFSDKINFCQDQMLNKGTPVGLPCFHKMYLYCWKPNTKSASWCMGWSRVMLTLFLNSFSHMASDSTQGSTSNAWRRYCYSPSIRWLLVDHTSCKRAQNQDTLAGERNLVWPKISATTFFLTPDHLILQIATPLIFVSDTVERATMKTLCNTKDELKARIMADFTNLNKENVRKACRKFRSRLEAVVEANNNLVE